MVQHVYDSELKIKLEGIWCPMATPLKKDGETDIARARELVDFLITNGVDGLFPLGTSGEFALLSDKERKAMAESVVDQTNGRVPVAVGVSDPCFEKVLGFSKEAKDIGADAIVATPPYYYTITDEAMYLFYKKLSEESELPVVVYNIPEWTHNFVSPDVVKRLADEKLVIGMKYTEYNFLNLMKFHKAAAGKIAVFTGSDALTCTNLEFGGSGAVIGISNVAPEKASSIFDEFKKGNLKKAKDIQTELLPVIEAIGIGKFPAGLKEAMKLVGMSVGEVKAPLLPLTTAERKVVREFISRSGLIGK
ncbi:MAG: dihydrodipicolinate synthase family protein [Nitrososphaerota archaeon]|nr:dihydrodipicolinate synthase family protein [Nitrososphaerota archaeon]